MKFVPVMFAALLLSACGNSSPTAPTPVAPAPPPAPTIASIAGTWRGTYTSVELGVGTTTLTLSQTTGGNVTGTWSTSDNRTGATNAGTISGTVNLARDVSLRFTPSNPATCPFQFTGFTYSTERRMDGQFVTVNCTVAASGILIVR